MEDLDGARGVPYLHAMAILSIITAPDPRLKVVSDPVEQVDDALRRLMDDMLETMYEAPGIGLAAVQVGVPKRVIVMDLAKEDEAQTPRFFVNPVISNTSEELAIYEEGCLSVPDMYEEVERPATARVTYLDYHGKEQIEDIDGMFATCLQHEMDHLNGILFIDHLSKLKRDMIIRKLLKLRRQQVPA